MAELSLLLVKADDEKEGMEGPAVETEPSSSESLALPSDIIANPLSDSDSASWCMVDNPSDVSSISASSPAPRAGGRALKFWGLADPVRSLISCTMAA